VRTRPLTLMAVHAHPDDEATGTGGVLARYASEGIRTVLVTCTDGACGDGPGGVKPGEPGHDPAAVVAMRRRELEASCAVLEVAHLETLDYADSGMMGWPTNELPGCFWQTPVDVAASRLAELIERYEPDVVVTYDENGFYGHPDHIQANRVTTAALSITGLTPKLYWTAAPRSTMAQLAEFVSELVAPGDRTDPEDEAQEPPRDEPASNADRGDESEAADLAQMGTPDEEITTWVDTRAFADKKFAALIAHASQTESTFFTKLDPDRFAELMGIETFVRVLDTTGAPVPEDDLFAGLR
jgi:LmbE family N-acetylglucosaminyl deacetylase